MKIAIMSSMGDPRDRATWSGTPYNIVAGLEDRGQVVTVESIAIGSIAALRLGSVANWINGYGTRQPTRAGLLSKVLRARAQRSLDRSDPGVYLHFGLDHFPLASARSDQAHYLFTDYSRGLIADQHSVGRSAPNKYRQLLKSAERESLRQYTGVFVTSEYVKEYFRQEYAIDEGKLHVVGSGFRVLQQIDQVRRPKSVLFVARQSFASKGGAVLVSAFPDIQRRHADAELTLVADERDPEIKPLLSKIRENPSISLVASNTQDLDYLMATSALYCAPAPCEPWGLIYLESMSVGTPVLGSSEGAVPEITQQGSTGIVVSDIHPEAVSNAVSDAFDSPDSLLEMGAKSRAHVRATYSWQNTVDMIIQVLSTGTRA